MKANRGRGRIIEETVDLSLPAVAVHGGAGDFSSAVKDEARRREVLQGMDAALQAAWELLSEGAPALDAAVAAVASMEDSGSFNAGRGAARTTAGDAEFDAAVMDGATGAAGGVCAVAFPANPVMVAREVASLGGPVDGPVLLAGAGGDEFAARTGASKMESHMLVSSGETASASGTVGAVAVDSDGRTAAATSTGGRAGQMPGRVGDTPIIGAGTWADDSTVAVSATGDGECFVAAGFAHLIDFLIREGRGADDAANEALRAVAGRGGHGGALVLSPGGHLTALFDSVSMARGWRDGSLTSIRAAESSDLSGT